MFSQWSETINYNWKPIQYVLHFLQDIIVAKPIQYKIYTINPNFKNNCNSPLKYWKICLCAVRVTKITKLRDSAFYIRVFYYRRILNDWLINNCFTLNHKKVLKRDFMTKSSVWKFKITVVTPTLLEKVLRKSDIKVFSQQNWTILKT